MAGVDVIQGVDDTLKEIAKQATSALVPKPTITVGPVDVDGNDLRVNWFLYRITPNAAYRNMEPPQRRSRGPRGNPPLALQLFYLLTAFPKAAPGDQEQFAHRALAAVMRAIQVNAIIEKSDPVLSNFAKPLVEPLRIAMDALDLETYSKIWTAAAKPLRLSVGYEVSLVIVDSPKVHAPGPPVRERRVIAIPTLGPRLVIVQPSRVAHGMDIAVGVQGLTREAAFSLAREDEDPAGSGDWTLTAVPDTQPDIAKVQLPRADLAPGTRRLDVAGSSDGLPAGRDSIGVTVVPTVMVATPTPATSGSSVKLTTAHAAPDVEVFFAGKRLSAGQVSYVSPTEVQVTVPPGTPSGPTEVQLRANGVAGPAFTKLAVA
jgi:hypothetical protein